MNANFSTVQNAIWKEVGRYGFMLAFRHTDESKPTGFGLISSERSRIASLHGIAKGVGTDFEFSAKHQETFDSDGPFTRSYLEKFAELMGINADIVINQLAERHYLWRFHGFVDGSFSMDSDNYPIWRPLWRKLKSQLSVNPVLSGVSTEASILLLEHLRHAAIEGCIVLDR